MHHGIEAAATYRLNDNWSFDFMGTMAEYYYNNNPTGIMNSENGKVVDAEEKVYMKTFMYPEHHNLPVFCLHVIFRITGF